MATRTPVAKASDFKDLEIDDIKGRLAKLGAKTSGSKEVLIKRLVVHNYPVAKLPRARDTSARGAVLLAYVEKDGSPKKEYVKDDDVAKQLVEKGLVPNEPAAVKSIRLYKYNLERYYGYEAVESDAGTKFIKRGN